MILTDRGAAHGGIRPSLESTWSVECDGGVNISSGWTLPRVWRRARARKRGEKAQLEVLFGWNKMRKGGEEKRWGDGYI